MATEYEKAHAKYRELAKAAANGDPVAKVDKAKAMNEIRSIEREAARAGTILSATYSADGKVQTQAKQTNSKRSLQEEYVRKFEDRSGPGGQEPTVRINGQETTLSAYHRKRLLGK